MKRFSSTLIMLGTVFLVVDIQAFPWSVRPSGITPPVWTTIHIEPPSLGHSNLPEIENPVVFPNVNQQTGLFGPSARTRLSKGYNLIQQKQYIEAIDMLRPIKSNYPSARQLIIYAMLKLQQYQEAIFELKSAGSYQSKTMNFIFAYRNLVREYVQIGWIDKAVEALRGLKEYLPKEAKKVLFQIANSQFVKKDYENAIIAYREVGADQNAYEGKARAEFAINRAEDSFATLSKLSSLNRRKAILLKGDLLLSIGAYPLAIEQYKAYPNDPNVVKIMNVLEKAGLSHFRATGSIDPKWHTFAPVKHNPASGSLTYLFRVKDGVLQPSPVFELSRIPAPRGWSVALVWEALKHMQWPETKQAKELRLTVNMPGDSHTAAIWDFPPPREDVLNALNWAYKAAEDFHKGRNALFHKEDAYLALEYFTKAASMPYAWAGRTDNWPHFDALAYALKALAGNFEHNSGAITLPEESLEKIRGLLFDHYPFFGRLSWAETLAESEKIDEARSLFDDIISDYPERYEAAERRAKVEWFLASNALGPEREQALHYMQVALARALERKPGHTPAVINQIKIYLLLGSYALASRAIVKSNFHNRDEKILGFFDLLSALRMRKFDKLGSLKSRTSGLTFEIYQNREAPPLDNTLIHHSAEITVIDKNGFLLETFAVASQAFDERSPRIYFLDRINSFGRDTLARYGQKRPDPQAVAEELANR